MSSALSIPADPAALTTAWLTAAIAAGNSSDQAAATVAVRHIAAFHAAWWDHPVLDAMTWLPDPNLGSNLPVPIRARGEHIGPHCARIEHHLVKVTIHPLRM